MSLSVTAAAALAPVLTLTPALTPGLTPAFASGRPTCAEPGNRDFPLRTRIHGGPAVYEPGGGYRTWYIDLTNTTDGTCGNIHPVVVLVDEKRVLKPGQPRLEFYDGERPRPVAFERTDEDENIGVFGSPEGAEGEEEGVFPGFTVAPGATLSVKVRLAVTSDAAVPNDVVAKAAVVQRHEGDDDGDWVGESNDYRFRIQDEDGEYGEYGEDGEDDEDDGGDASDQGNQRDQRDERGQRDQGSEGDRDNGATPEAVPPNTLPFAEELARTGLDSPRAILGVTVGALLLLGAGAGALLAARRRR